VANEISLSVYAAFAKSGQSFNTDDLDLLGQTIDVSGSHYIRRTVTATTSQAALDIGSITNCGLLIGINRGSVAVNLRSGSSGANTASFPAGKGYAMYLATNTPYVITGSSTAVFEYILVEA